MQFIDTHAHLYQTEFENDLDNILLNCKNNGIEQILIPNVDAESWPLMLDLQQKYPSQIKMMLGIHPCYVQENYGALLSQMICDFDAQKYIAIGEIGIDLYWDKSTLQIQQDAFVEQIRWAKKVNLPIVIHARESFNEIFEILDQEINQDLKGVFHCFTGGETERDKILTYPNFYFGIGGVVTYKKSNLPTVIPEIPNELLVLETDAPYLSPVPHRGKRNEPNHLLHTAQKLAEIKNLSLQEIAKITTQNAQKLFGI